MFTFRARLSAVRRDQVLASSAAVLAVSSACASFLKRATMLWNSFVVSAWNVSGRLKFTKRAAPAVCRGGKEGQRVACTQSVLPRSQQRLGRGCVARTESLTAPSAQRVAMESDMVLFKVRFLHQGLSAKGLNRVSTQFKQRQ